MTHAHNGTSTCLGEVRSIERVIGEHLPFALYLEGDGGFHRAIARGMAVAPEFAAGGGLAGYLRGHPRPILPTRSRRGQSMLRTLRRDEREAIVAPGTAAIVPLLASGALLGFILLGRPRGAGEDGAVAPEIVAEVARVATWGAAPAVAPGFRRRGWPDRGFHAPASVRP